MADKILIVEDEVRIARTLRLYLEQAGFSVTAVHDGLHALPAFRQERPSLVLLDLNLPGLDGLDVCRTLRREGNVPIIMVTARTEEMDRLIGLELGADDYVVKPFSPREVVARIRAVLRRTQGATSTADTVRAGDLLLDLAGRRAWLGDHLLLLTQSEFEILAVLVQHKERVLSRAQLLEAAQGIAHEEFARTIDQHIKNLRRKMKDAVGDVPIIQTIYGVGYRLDEVVLSP
ncbi:MAG: response regulator transcription factor [Ardenticatenaceae bacterium]|nr:response regulator transcription factor [Ardenticatenaceae bacterium]